MRWGTSIATMRSPRSSTLARSGGLPDRRAKSVNGIDRFPPGPRTKTLGSKAPNATVRQRFDLRQILQPVDVQETLGKYYTVFHETDQVGAARDEGEMSVLRMGCDRG